MAKKDKIQKEWQSVKARPAIPRSLVIFLFSALVVSAGIIAFIFIYTAGYEDKIFPNTYIGGLAVGNKTFAEAEALLSAAANKQTDAGLGYSYQGNSFSIKSITGDPANPELVSPLFTYDIKKSVSNLHRLQSNRSEFSQIWYRLFGSVSPPELELNQGLLQSALQEELSSYEQPAKNAELTLGADGTASVSDEKSGMAFPYKIIINQISSRLKSFSQEPIIVSLAADEPEITKSDGLALLPLVEQVLASAPFQLIYQDDSWDLSVDQLKARLAFVVEDGRVTVGLDPVKINEYLTEIAKEINQPVQEGKFTLGADGRVTEFQPSQNGQTLALDKTESAINQKIKEVGIKEIDLVVEEIEPQLDTASVNDMGIKELVGEGYSNFKGSPKNRRINISVGADKLNGILIKPGEEFSLVKALGAIEASTGYLPELVIKGNKTTPEFGGGLCQIGTTLFRAVLSAGLPVLERKSHSYRVSYYEPAGIDATIYDPKPDFRFLNDTGNYLLLTTEISGDDLFFRFYGTKDGRTVEQTKPRIFNQVKPGPTKLIETTDLKPGEKKCTEKAHTGADAEFTRTVTYSNGEKKVDVFKSHYKPWQEVCLIGVEKTAIPPPVVDEPVF